MHFVHIYYVSFYEHVMYYSPLQVAPSLFNKNPVLHSHVKLPSVFIHVCEQPPLSSLHSLVSGRTECMYEYFNNNYIVCA